ncbi:MAG: alpha/beta hydrolase [Betaproteobacteria bacterium]|nr:alpha/beta hydrolase [Betaproteobacteria bacterium]
MNHFFADDGEKIHVHHSGSGTPSVVMLHGWTSSHQEWFPFLPALTARHHVYRWDARGHGGHALTRQAAPTVQRMARDLHNLLSHYDLEESVVVGHSMGALTLWQYIRDYGCDRLGKVCFIDQSPRLVTDPEWQHGIYGDFDHSRSERFLEELDADFPEAVLRLGALGLNDRARQKYLENAKGWEKARLHLQSLKAQPLIDCWRSLTEADYRDVLKRIDVPALLIYGGESNFYRNETAHYVAERIPQAVLHIYESTDHSPHQWQRERFTRDLLGFIAS